jgi:hypothetical protein
MKTYHNLFTVLNFRTLIVAGFSFLFLMSSSYGRTVTKRDIKKLFKNNRQRSSKEKIQIFGTTFLGVPTGKGPLGEGKEGEFDKDPVFRFDLFDCTTYVETVLALSLARNFDDFKNIIKDIRYHRGNVSFLKRNHFISLDWIPNNTQSGFVRDTTRILFPNNSTVALSQIDKKSWYRKKTISDIQGQNNLNRQQKKKLLKGLNQLGENFSVAKAKISYVSLKDLFKNPNMIKRIPNNAIISIVRPNWNLKKVIGTNLNVSHQGLAVVKNGVLYYRHATSGESKRVIDTTFKKYFKRYLTSPTIKGVNILEVL